MKYLWFTKWPWMHSTTLHNLDDALYALLKQKARKEGKSLNRAIQELLAEAVGLKKKAVHRAKKDVYTELCGAMTASELKEMEEAERDFDWQ